MDLDAWEAQLGHRQVGNTTASSRQAAAARPAGSARNPQTTACHLLATAGVDTEEEGEAADDAEGQEGVEGLDWRYGSVEELDPTEWQVRCSSRRQVSA